eukprot:1738884-Rhodomonas_salina.1
MAVARAVKSMADMNEQIIALREHIDFDEEDSVQLLPTAEEQPEQASTQPSEAPQTTTSRFEREEYRDSGVTFLLCMQSCRAGIQALISRNTLLKHVRAHGTEQPNCIGRAPKLPKEGEYKIVSWIKLASSIKLSTSLPIIKQMVNLLLEDLILQHYFPNGQVTNFWYYSFRKRWQGVLGEKYSKKHEIQRELWTNLQNMAAFY